MRRGSLLNDICRYNLQSFGGCPGDALPMKDNKFILWLTIDGMLTKRLIAVDCPVCQNMPDLQIVGAFDVLNSRSFRPVNRSRNGTTFSLRQPPPITIYKNRLCVVSKDYKGADMCCQRAGLRRFKEEC